MKLRAKYISALLLLIIVMMGLSTHVAQAQAGALASLFGLDLAGFALGLLANLAYYALTIASWFLTVCGTILNASINLTLHISQLLTAIPAVYSTWTLIRDVSSMFFIFALLYAAITMILGIEKQSFGDFIKNIIIAGILINFSFFIVGTLIDASNVISLQFYRAIAPGKEYGQDVNSLSSIASQAFNDGGISNVFMQALQPQTFYENKGQLSKNNVNTQMLIAGVGGTVIMIIAALSFLAAALAFCIRTGMLLLLLAFSPLWMAGRVIPQIKTELADPWWKYLYSNLIFMPVYLLFLYVAMRMLLGDNPPATSISHLLNGTAGKTSDGLLGASYFGMILSYVLAILLINAPLVAAMKVGGSSMEWGKKYSGTAGKIIGGWVGKNTVGRAALATDKYLAKTRIGNIELGREIRSATIGALAKNKMGGDSSYIDIEKEHKDVVQKGKEIKRLNDLRRLISTNDTDPAKYKALIEVMNGKEKLELKPKILNNIEVLKQLDQSDFDAIKKTEDLDFTDDIKEQIKQKRRDALLDAVKRATKMSEAGVDSEEYKKYTDAVGHMIEESNGKELMKQIGRKKPGSDELGNALINPVLVEHLTQSQLKEMEDEGIDPGTKEKIGSMIDNWYKSHPKNHRAVGYVRREDNKSWLGEKGQSEIQSSTSINNPRNPPMFSKKY